MIRALTRLRAMNATRRSTTTIRQLGVGVPQPRPLQITSLRERIGISALGRKEHAMTTPLRDSVGISAFDNDTTALVRLPKETNKNQSFTTNLAPTVTNEPQTVSTRPGPVNTPTLNTY